MQDPWKYLAFPLAAISGYSVSLMAIEGVSETLGLPDFATNLAIIAAAGLLTGFVVDSLIPAYVDKVRGGSDSLGGSDFDDSDLEGDMDFD